MLINFNTEFKTALEFIPSNSRTDAIRLLNVLADSGADAITALAALYRWTKERPQYEPINRGIADYFKECTRLYASKGA